MSESSGWLQSSYILAPKLIYLDGGWFHLKSKLETNVCVTETEHVGPLVKLTCTYRFLLPAPTLCQCIRKRNVEFSSLSIVCHSPRYHASFPNLNDPFRQRDMSSRSSIWYRGEMDFIKFLSLSFTLHTFSSCQSCGSHTVLTELSVLKGAQRSSCQNQYFWNCKYGNVHF